MYKKLYKPKGNKMTLRKILSLVLLASSFTVASCQTTPNSSTSSSVTTSTPASESSSSESSSSSSTSSEQVTLDTLWTDQKTITVAAALALIPNANDDNGGERVLIKVKIDEIQNEQYGQMQVSDSTGEILVYGAYSADGKDRYSVMEKKPIAGDYVLFSALLTNYKGTKEIKSGWILDFHSNTTVAPFDPSAYAFLTAKEARLKAVGEKVRVKGQVAQFTYDASLNKTGFLLEDGTDGLAVYDQVTANKVAIGDTVDICGTRENYISSRETELAAKWGYTGAIQISDCTAVEITKGDGTLNLSWVANKTVKEILDTPITDNITSQIFATTALITKVPGDGFVNYYINDLDSKTGTYSYTTANGKEYGWLDEFDGKVCSVYLSTLNAKSTATSTNWRFLPIEVKALDNYSYPQDKAAQFAIDYYAVDQFMDSYTADPELAVKTTVESPNSFVDLSNVKISYASDNTSVVNFTTDNGVTVFHTGSVGTAKVTIEATNGSYAKGTKTLEITVKEKPDYSKALNIASTLKAERGSDVISVGVIGPSLVNKTGFYLIDETGSISVELARDSYMKGLAVGKTVVVGGKISDSSSSYFGITDAQILDNQQGHKDYSTASFISGKTVKQIKEESDYADPLTYTKIFSLTDVKIEAKADSYSTHYYVMDFSETDTKNGIDLYMASANQFAYLKDYIGSKDPVSIELALVNFNGKKYIRGNALSVTNAEGVKVINQLNFNN